MRVAGMEIIDKREQPVLYIRSKVSQQELPKAIEEAYGKLGQYLGGLGEYLCDMPYVAYYNMDATGFEVEMGFPVKKELPGSGEIQYGVLPGGKVLMTIDRGPYSGLEGIYGEMAEYIQKNGFQDQEVAYEFYLNGPQDVPSEDELLTIIQMPIA